MLIVAGTLAVVAIVFLGQACYQWGYTAWYHSGLGDASYWEKGTNK